MIILDTNVVSELMRPVPDANVVDWVVGQAARNLYLSAVSEAEPTVDRRPCATNDSNAIMVY